ncbi:MAG: hypothetical protein EZS28_014410, partial [Streblomastix strix]
VAFWNEARPHNQGQFWYFWLKPVGKYINYSEPSICLVVDESNPAIEMLKIATESNSNLEFEMSVQIMPKQTDYLYFIISKDEEVKQISSGVPTIQASAPIDTQSSFLMQYTDTQQNLIQQTENNKYSFQHPSSDQKQPVLLTPSNQPTNQPPNQKNNSVTFTEYLNNTSESVGKSVQFIANIISRNTYGEPENNFVYYVTKFICDASNASTYKEIWVSVVPDSEEDNQLKMQIRLYVKVELRCVICEFQQDYHWFSLESIVQLEEGSNKTMELQQYKVQSTDISIPQINNTIHDQDVNSIKDGQQTGIQLNSDKDTPQIINNELQQQQEQNNKNNLQAILKTQAPLSKYPTVSDINQAQLKNLASQSQIQIIPPQQEQQTTTEAAPASNIHDVVKVRDYAYYLIGKQNRTESFTEQDVNWIFQFCPDNIAEYNQKSPNDKFKIIYAILNAIIQQAKITPIPFPKPMEIYYSQEEQKRKALEEEEEQRIKALEEQRIIRDKENKLQIEEQNRQTALKLQLEEYKGLNELESQLFDQGKVLSQSAQQIIKTGFRPGQGGIAGGGIYFALNKKDTNRKAHQKGVILECQVDVGSCKIMKQKEPQLTGEELKRQGFDSVYFPAQYMDVTLNLPEYVIYNPTRVKSIKIIPYA